MTRSQAKADIIDTLGNAVTEDQMAEMILVALDDALHFDTEIVEASAVARGKAGM
jgi:hypothetical protein